jgi:hypothetical protein
MHNSPEPVEAYRVLGGSPSWAEASVREEPNMLLASCVAAASAVLAGKLAEAGKEMVHVRHLDPAFLFPIRRPKDFTRLSEALRKAGLPE